MASRSVRSLVTVVMDVLVIVALILLGRLVVGFFAATASTAWGSKTLELTSMLVLPLGVHAVKTPYGGAFDLNATITLLLLLAAEWLLDTVRRQA